MKIFICLIVFVILIVCAIIEFSFHQVVLAKRKSKEDALKLLKERGLFEEGKFKAFEEVLEEVEIKSLDGFKLKGFFYKSNSSNKLIIFVHGYTANHYIGFQFLDLYIEEGFNVLLVDERGHGESEGKFATYGINEREDIKLWINFMRSKLSDLEVIGLHGQSMGAATALMYVGKFNDVDFIIADCPYSEGEELLKYQFKEIGKLPPTPVYMAVNKIIKSRCGFSMEDVSPISDIRECSTPILFIHGKSDHTIPYSMSQEMYKIRKNKMDRILLVDDADHVMSYAKGKSDYNKILKEYLQSIKIKSKTN